MNQDRGRAFQVLRSILLSVALGTPAWGVQLDLPPLVAPASGEHHVGKVVWTELVTPDVESAQRFYGALFVWTFRDVPGVKSAVTSATDRDAPSRYVVALLDDQPVAGLLLRGVTAVRQVQPAWLTFLAVNDADEVARHALAMGARVLAEPKSYGRRGRQAILADPQGAIFAILFSPGGDAPDELADPGQWIWSSLLVRDADKAAAFYQGLLGYEVFELPSADGREHVVLATDNLARASVNAMPAESTRNHPHWLNFVRVLNATETVARARSLGGHVLVEPHADRHGGQVAVIADPQGAPFGVMEWSQPAEQGIAK